MLRFFMLLCLSGLALALPATASAQASRQPDRETALRRLSGGLQIPTVGNTDFAMVDLSPFDAFKTYLEQAYPRLYRAMETSTVNDYGLVFRWPGRDPARKPILLLSHYDVVPAQGEGRHPGTVFQPDDPPLPAAGSTQVGWDYGPFSGAVADGRIYGRGSLDMKGMLFGILEAADRLLAEGFVPDQDIWFAFGHDEENGGQQGAARIAEEFAARGLSFDAVFDEGGLIGREGAVLESLQLPVAVVGVGEKGFLNLKITVRGLGGHSSMPPARSSLVLASELALLLNDNPLPARIIPPVASFLRSVEQHEGIDIPGIDLRQLDEAKLLQALESFPATNALIRTTTAVTMMAGSEAPNVLSATAELVVNFRLLPGDTVEQVMDHVRRLCAGYDVTIETVGAPREPSKLSSEQANGFLAIRESLKRVYPDIAVIPYITVGGTDAYKYQAVSDHIYRFMPVSLNLYEVRTIHGDNEYMSLDNYETMIRYFMELMRAYARSAQ